MTREGDPRVQITVTEDIFATAHDVAKREGWQSTSAWLRDLLAGWDGRELVTRGQKQLSVRLDDWHRRRLDQLARRCQLSRSQAFALLIERALRPVGTSNVWTTVQRQAHTMREPAQKSVAMPGATAYRQWARLILDAARATPHKLGRKAFIAGAIDHLIARLQPDDPRSMRARIRDLLPELNRQGLVPLSRADLVSAMDPDLVARSEIAYLNAKFHFIDL